MAVTAEITITVDETSGDLARDLYAETGFKELAALKLIDTIKKYTSGAHPATIRTRVNSVKASGTITLASHTTADTVTIGTVTITATTDYSIAGDDTADAAALAAAINANTTLDGQVIATSAAAVVTVTALDPGEDGNAIALAISARGSVSAATLTGGTNGTNETTHYFGSAS